MAPAKNLQPFSVRVGAVVLAPGGRGRVEAPLGNGNAGAALPGTSPATAIEIVVDDDAFAVPHPPRLPPRQEDDVVVAASTLRLTPYQHFVASQLSAMRVFGSRKRASVIRAELPRLWDELPADKRVRFVGLAELVELDPVDSKAADSKTASSALRIAGRPAAPLAVAPLPTEAEVSSADTPLLMRLLAIMTALLKDHEGNQASEALMLGALEREFGVETVASKRAWITVSWKVLVEGSRAAEVAAQPPTQSDGFLL